MADKRSSETFDWLVAYLGQHRERIEGVFKALHDEIMRDLTGARIVGVPKTDRIGFYPLARALDYYVIALEAERNSKGSLIQPGEEPSRTRPYLQWKKWLGEPLSALTTSFKASTGHVILQTPEADDLSHFCKLTAHKRGSEWPLFYASAAALLLLLSEKGELNRPAYKALLPEGERDLPRRIRTRIRRLAGEAPARKPVTVPPKTSLVHLPFIYDHDSAEKLEVARAYYAGDSDRPANFFVYRASRSDPLRLMKSYLTIAPPVRDDHGADDDPGSFHFTHVYKPPKGEDSSHRFTSGRALIFTDGIFLAGGLHNERDSGRDPQVAEALPPKSLKVLAIPRQKFLDRQEVLPCLVLSTNYKGRHLATRAAIQPTLLPDDGTLTIGTVMLAELRKSLEDDAAREEALLADDSKLRALFAGRTRSTAHDDEARILSMTNNRPGGGNGWSVLPGFATNGKRKRILDREEFERALAGAFKPSGHARYTIMINGQPVGFEVPASMRFGPLVQPD